MSIFIQILHNFKKISVLIVISSILTAKVPREGCFLKAKAGNQEMNFLYTTGKRDVDVAINLELGSLKQMFGQNPVFYLVKMNNAFATTQYFDQPPGIYPTLGAPVTGTVALGTELLEKEMYQSRTGQGFNLPAILAHEFGHLVQFQMGNNMPSTKLKELQADALAGWYMVRRSYFVPTELGEALDGFFRMGDTNFQSPGHHGTPDERRAAIRWGMENAARLRNIMEAYQVSHQWIVANYPPGRADGGSSNSASLVPRANFGMPEGFTPEKIPLRTPFGDCDSCGSFGDVLKQIWLSMDHNFTSIRDPNHSDYGLLNLPGMKAKIKNNSYYLIAESKNYIELQNIYTNLKNIIATIFEKFDESPLTEKNGDEVEYEEFYEITSKRDYKIAIVCNIKTHKMENSELKIIFSRK